MVLFGIIMIIDKKVRGVNMDRFWWKFIKSVLLGLIIPIVVLYILSFVGDGDFLGIYAIGVAIISSLFYCTYNIIDEIKKINK